jgi:hypothetical protein
MNCENLENIILQLLSQSPRLCIVSREKEILVCPSIEIHVYERFIQVDEEMDLYVCHIDNDEIVRERVETFKQAVKYLK